ncbi:MAG: ATP-binding protein [Candidatus Saccharibacteria bacterium]
MAHDNKNMMNSGIWTIRLKIVIVSLIMSIAISITVGYISYRVSYDTALEEVRRILMVGAQGGALLVNGDLQKNLIPGAENTPGYQNQLRVMQNFWDKSKFTYVYTMKPGGSTGARFIVDGAMGREDSAASIGEEYEPKGSGLSPEMKKALNGTAAVEEKPAPPDKWGTFISGYAPFYDSHGNFVGIFGVDIEVSHLDNLSNILLRSIFYACLIGLLIAFLVYFFFVRSTIILPIERLTAKTREIAAGDYDALLDINRKDEIGVLGNSFNNMIRTIRQYNLHLEDLVRERTVQLQKAYEDLKELDQVKSDFFSNVSHELRTPLTSIVGFAKIIRRRIDDLFESNTDVDPVKLNKAMRKTHEEVEIIALEGERLTGLINDFLDLAKMEAGKLEWRSAPVDVGSIIHRAINATRPLFSAKNLDLIAEIEPDLPLVAGDGDRLIQVVVNLLSNAAKFTEQGQVKIQAHRKGEEIKVSVIDSGIGIALEDQPKVFDKFQQVGSTLTNKPSGTGLGLPICSQIVEHHNGRLWLESELGNGTTFSFTLPLVSDVEIPFEKATYEELLSRLKGTVNLIETSPQKPARVLVVDDDANIRRLLKIELELQKYQVFEASSGIEAISQARTCHPDLILMDVMMPDMNGFDVASVLKNNAETANIPIFIISVVEDRAKGYRIGIDGYFSKPIDTALLLEQIGLVTAQTARVRKILILSLNHEKAESLSESLQGAGYEVAISTREDKYASTALAQNPDLIILDGIPINYRSVLHRLHSEHKLSRASIVVIQESETKNPAAN